LLHAPMSRMFLLKALTNRCNSLNPVGHLAIITTMQRAKSADLARFRSG
jgi:hypothetical protein